MLRVGEPAPDVTFGSDRLSAVPGNHQVGIGARAQLGARVYRVCERCALEQNRPRTDFDERSEHAAQLARSNGLHSRRSSALVVY